MAEVVNAIVAFAVIIFIFRWVTSPSAESSGDVAAARALKFKPKKVSDEMTNQICGMFPDIPRENVHYDLLRTGSVERTTEKILERGFLDAPPPAYFTIYPRQPAPTAPQARPGATPTGLASSSASASRKSETLISRFKLEQRAAELEKQEQARKVALELEEAGGKAAWEDTAEKRERSLRERKERMILAARQRMLEKQQQQAATQS
ncbi:uncharacterized protein STEHIDRAFT_148705 [Stereum hirsutum FP-91666 SS1]|uniref:uncharacterized protein n=1 Tax=Stereum hirsutum (strain FP-91666) TaxID=721885 RepID=UPI0004449D7F|nr:uncharacterized protein STEHIDRAFT_148705 [Stereum hirsutum FP-91666 SS1]EIM83974.1 hypothetical protein STEHIDRAFT_148705 [Stereum hirsutum FP-91666 SS1]